jgi:hypothetical protein
VLRLAAAASDSDRPLGVRRTDGVVAAAGVGVAAGLAADARMLAEEARGPSLGGGAC